MQLTGDHNEYVTRPDALAERIDATERVMSRWLKSSGYKVSHLVMSGISGQSVGWPLSARLQLPALVVRKPKEEAHSGLIVGQGVVKDYVLVDDFISTGSTINRIVSAITEKYFSHPLSMPENMPICRAIFTYNRGYTDYEVHPDGRHIYRPSIRRDDNSVIPLDLVYPDIPVVSPRDDGL